MALPAACNQQGSGRRWAYQGMGWMNGIKSKGLLRKGPPCNGGRSTGARAVGGWGPTVSMHSQVALQ